MCCLCCCTGTTLRGSECDDTWPSTAIVLFFDLCLCGPACSQYRKRPERSDRDDISSLASSTEEQRGPSSGTMWAVGVLGPLIGAVVAIGAYLAIDRLKERARLLGHSRLATGDVEDKRGFQLAAFRTASDT